MTVRRRVLKDSGEARSAGGPLPRGGPSRTRRRPCDRKVVEWSLSLHGPVPVGGRCRPVNLK